jgi:hypothetical protein
MDGQADGLYAIRPNFPDELQFAVPDPETRDLIAARVNRKQESTAGTDRNRPLDGARD